jgi:G3E family GTPase
MSARRPPPPVPVIVLTGFLGAGKTTLLNRLLKDDALAGSMVVINELGEAGIDHLLVETREDVTLLASGCLCCALRGDLAATLEDLCRRVDNGRLAPFPRLILETSGLADPAPILATFAEHPYLRLRYRLAGVVTVVDAANGLASLDAQPEAERQAAAADLLVLTKTDLPDGRRARDELLERLAALAPGAPLIEAATTIDLAGVLPDVASDLAPSRQAALRWLAAEEAERQMARRSPIAASDLDAERAQAALHAEHDCVALGCVVRGLVYKGLKAPADPARHGQIRAHVIRSDVALPPPALDLFIELLRGAHGPKLLRVKGLVKLADDPARPVALQGAQHVIHPLARLDAWPDGLAQTRIVTISRDLDSAYIQALWDAFATSG